MKKVFSIFLSLLLLNFLAIPSSFAGNMKKRERQKFSQEEDNMLIQLVNQHGTLNWNLIASHMPNRNPRQCRERWKHYLSVKENRREPFTPEEDRVIFEKFNELGPKWTKIANFLPNRSDISIKNRFLTFIRFQYNIPRRYCTRFRNFQDGKKDGVFPSDLGSKQDVAVPVKQQQDAEGNNDKISEKNDADKIALESWAPDWSIGEFPFEWI